VGRCRHPLLQGDYLLAREAAEKAAAQGGGGSGAGGGKALAGPLRRLSNRKDVMLANSGASVEVPFLAPFASPDSGHKMLPHAGRCWAVMAEKAQTFLLRARARGCKAFCHMSTTHSALLHRRRPAAGQRRKRVTRRRPGRRRRCRLMCVWGRRRAASSSLGPTPAARPPRSRCIHHANTCLLRPHA
jgi:hypothetical protein